MKVRSVAAALSAAAIAASLTACRRQPTPIDAGPPPPPVNWNALAARVDPYVAKPRVIVITDIANEPDDQMSMVRFLVYANEFDVEGLIAATSTWMRDAVRPDVIQSLIGTYGQVQPNLLKHAPGFPAPSALAAVVAAGQPGYGMGAVGRDELSAGASLIIHAVNKADDRPLWVVAWGGVNTLAEALLQVRTTRPPAAVAKFVSKLRVYSISDQDDAGPWIRREFPTLFYIVMPSTPDGDQYYLATWTGISGDHFYRNDDGADFTTFSEPWVNAYIRTKGPLGKRYPLPCCIYEGDTPSFLGLIDNGLASAMSPTYGGWGGRYVWRQFYGESHPMWTQGGDSYPGRDSSRDTVVGADGTMHTSDQATIWRWRDAFQHDFAARMAWTVEDVRHANHNPEVVVNGHAGKAPIDISAQVGVPVVLDATGTRDPDGDALRFTWVFYPEAGTGIPARPVFAGGLSPVGGGGSQSTGGIPSAGPGGAEAVPPRVTVQDEHGMKALVMPDIAGVSHVILAVEDNGTPSLTSYRRIIFRVRPALAAQTPGAK